MTQPGVGIPRRELLRRGAALGLSTTALGSLLAACGSGDDGEAAGGGTVGKWLTLWSQQPGDTPYGKTFKAAADRWTAAESGRSFRPVVVDPASYLTKFKTVSAAGDAPDVWQASLDGSYADLINAGLLTPLDDLIGDKPYFDVAVGRLKFDGKTYAVPLDVNNLSIAYNTEIFDELGLQPPATLDELVALAKSLRDGGYEPLATGVKEKWPAADVFFAQLAYTDPDGTALDAATRGEIGWDDSVFTQAAELASEIQKGGVLVKGVASVDGLGSLSLLASKKAAMAYPGIGDISPYVGKDLKYDFFPFPPPDSSMEPRATGGPAVMFAVPSKGKNPEGAKQLIQLMADDKGVQELIENNFVPPFEADTSSNKAAPYQALASMQATAAPRGIFDAKVSASLFDGMANLLSGRGGPQDVINGLTSAAG